MAIDRAALDAWGMAFRGRLIEPQDPDYDQARTVWNVMIDKRPALVARCADSADVATAVRFAREQGLDAAVRGGGHSAAGKSTCDDGIVIDLSAMRGVRVDPMARTARAQGGVTWGHYDHETTSFRLASPGRVI